MSRKIIFGLLIALAFVPDRLPGAAAPVMIQRIGYLTANSSAVPIQNTSWQMPASNADIGMTLAHILGLQIQRKGVLVGRVLREALKSDGSTQPVKKFQRLSSPSSNGLQTVLDLQVVGDTVYFDAAGFPGRTLGLEPLQKQ